MTWNNVQYRDKDRLFKKHDYLVVVLVVLASGNMAIIGGERDRYSLVIITCVIAAVYMLKKVALLTRRALFVVFIFIILLMIQSLQFDSFPYVTYTGFLLRIVIGYLAVRVVYRFEYKFVWVIFTIAVMSLIFYVADQGASAIGLNIRQPFSLLANLVQSEKNFDIGIYNFQLGERSYRNAAVFWEPGAFAGYTLLGLMFLSVIREQLSNRVYYLQMSVLSLGLLSTFSTMGYLVFPFVIILHYRWARASRNQKMLAIPAFIVLVAVMAVYAVQISKFDFISQKMIEQYTLGIEKEYGWQLNRFGAILFDWEYIQKKPFIGWGPNPDLKFQLHPDMEIYATGNGMSGFVHQFGFIGMMLVLWFVGRSFISLTGGNVLRGGYMLLLFLLILNGEHFLSHPLFLGLMFFPEIVKDAYRGQQTYKSGQVNDLREGE